jgi:hypothetical protein
MRSQDIHSVRATRARRPLASTLFCAFALSVGLLSAACSQPVGDENVGVSQEKITQAECQAENGTWYQEQCVLGVVDVTADPDPLDTNCWPGDPCYSGGDDPIDPPPPPPGGGGSGDPPVDPPPAVNTVQVFSGSASALRAWANERTLRAESETNAHETCEANVEWSANNVSHCDEGMYIWGNRVIHTDHATQCELGYLYKTCTTTITINTTVVGG